MELNCPHCFSAHLVDAATPLSNLHCPSYGRQFSVSESDTLIGDLSGSETEAEHHTLSLVANRFQLVERVGSGASSIVWKARDTLLDRIVALKIYRRPKSESGHFEQLCLREARAIARCGDPRIVTIYDVIFSEDMICTVCEFVQGWTLNDWSRSDRLSVSDAVELCASIAETLHRIHESGLIHRDLKPGNIIVDTHGQPHILDLGLAFAMREEVTATTVGTTILGTPTYMAPEQAKGQVHRIKTTGRAGGMRKAPKRGRV